PDPRSQGGHRAVADHNREQREQTVEIAGHEARLTPGLAEPGQDEHAQSEGDAHDYPTDDSELVPSLPYRGAREGADRRQHRDQFPKAVVLNGITRPRDALSDEEGVHK